MDKGFHARVPDAPFVYVYHNNLSNAVTRLRKQLLKAGLLRELRDRRVGVSKSGRKRMKWNRALKKFRKRQKSKKR